MQHPTTVSVGPYSLIRRVAGALARQNATASAFSASPPITSARTRPASDAAGSRWLSAWTCAGVSLSRLRLSPLSIACWSASTPCASGSRSTQRPHISGVYRLVTVRSKPTGEWTGAPLPSATR